MSKQHNNAPRKRLKIFISYNSADRDWAEWVAGVLDVSGYQPIIQAWHFRPGENFVLRMHEAMSETHFTIAILSEHYLKATFTQPEWAAALAQGATGKQRKLIPVRVAKCKLTGLLSQIIYIDLVGLDELVARQALLDGLKPNGKPSQPPPFPRRDGVAKVRQAPFPPTRKHFAQHQGRKYALWRLAYSFLRLDQLPSGGWGKSLPQWMEAIWEGDAGTIVRSPEMRRDGGTDFTCAAFHNYVHFIERFLLRDSFAEFARENPVPGHLFKSLQSRIDHDRGMNTGLTGRRVLAKVNIRHTAMGMISLMLCGKPDGFAVVGKDELKLTASYLNCNLKHWQLDKSHAFAMFAALARLVQMLENNDGIQQFAGYAAEDRKLLISSIRSVLPRMRHELTNFGEYLPLPEHTQTNLDARPFFLPYGRFWRMERTGFLMYMPLLIAEDGSKFVGYVGEDDGLKRRFAQCFHELLEDVIVPFDLHHPELSMVKHHRRAGNIESPRDWGLTAELAFLLDKAVIRELMLTHFDYTKETLSDLSKALEDALMTTFDEFHKRPEVFKFTQSLSFSRCLDLIRDDEIQPQDLTQLDRAIGTLLEEGVTENSLNAFVADQIVKNNSKMGKATSTIPVNMASVRDLLLNKLQSGEHTSDEKICSPMKWEQLNRDTIEYYEGVGGKRYAERYENKPIVDYVSPLNYVFKQNTFHGMKALDVACGPGQYAKLLKERGFDIDLYDASIKMLKLAAKRIGKRKCPKSRDYYRLKEECNNEQYHLVFASAMMVHVPVKLAPQIYEQFYRILKPGGVLFVNYKIGDHSLIDLDGRFYQYYRSREQPSDMLKTAGFRIEAIVELWNDRTSNDLPREICWVSFFCVKPEASDKDAFPNSQRTH